jgi:hypothetical protein
MHRLQVRIKSKRRERWHKGEGHSCQYIRRAGPAVLKVRLGTRMPVMVLLHCSSTQHVASSMILLTTDFGFTCHWRSIGCEENAETAIRSAQWNVW